MNLTLAFARLISTVLVLAVTALSLSTPSPVLAQQSQCLPPPAGILSWWPGDGNANDIVGTNHGQLQGAAALATGQVGSGFRFDGVSGFLQAGTANLPIASQDRSLELWFRADSFVVEEAMLAGYGGFGSGLQSYALGTTNSGSPGSNRPFFSTWGPSMTGPVLVPGRWYHLAVTNVGESSTLYLDGAPVVSGLLPMNTAVGTTMYMGRIPGPLGEIRRLNGMVDEVSVYNRALSPSEVRSVFDAGAAGKCKSPGRGSLRLNGVSAYAETPHTGDLDLTAGWTVEAWIRDYHPGGFNHRRARILTKGDTTGPEVPYFIGIESNGLFAGLRTGGTPFVVRYDLATNRVNPASWHHVAATLNASAGILTLYLDGVVVASAPVSARSLGNTGPLSIGRSGPASNDYWKGKIDDVRIWNVARNASEIAASFRTELVGPQTGLAANWRFNEGSGFTAIDSAGGHLAVLNGGALFSAEVHP